MINLLRKEFLLAAHPTLYIFSCMGALLLVPSYPYSTVFLYGCLAPFITFQFGRENNDVFYTATLPIGKREVVKGKCLLFMTAHLGQLLISLPFAFLRTVIYPAGNVVGMEANVAYYGFGLMIFGVYTFVFLTQFYKTAYRIGWACIKAMIPAMIGMVLVEALPHIPACRWLDGMEPAMLVRQLPILLCGIVIYALSMLFGYRIAASRFEKVDL